MLRSPPPKRRRRGRKQQQAEQPHDRTPRRRPFFATHDSVSGEEVLASRDSPNPQKCEAHKDLVEGAIDKILAYSNETIQHDSADVKGKKRVVGLIDLQIAPRTTTPSATSASPDSAARRAAPNPVLHHRQRRALRGGRAYWCDDGRR